MKINQVEELVGITKKNIRFYEAQGLLNPERDPGNGYREYSLQDVEQLQKIRLLRKLDVPCEQIRLVTTGELTLAACLGAQKEKLEAHSRDLAQMQELCGQIAASGTEYDSLGAAGWLEQMQELEKGGVRFMNAEKSDVKRRRWGALISALVSVLFMAALAGTMLWANMEDPIPAGILLFVLVIPLVCIAGIVLALIQRMKELKSGELDEAGKY